MTDTVHLGDVPVGDSHPTVFVAEIGSFFKKDIELAMESLSRVADAGAPVFKTEILHSADVVLPDTGLTHTYSHASGKKTQDYRALIEERVTPLKDYERIFRACADLKMPIIASVFDFSGVDFMKDMKAAGIKLSRNYINHLPLLEYAAKSGLPVILDVGEAYFSETCRATELIIGAGAPMILNHHPGPTPSLAAIHNLRLISTYKQALSIPVGLSCHYRGDLMLYAATIAGANLLEKGICADPDQPEADIVSAAPFSDLPRILENVRECWLALGDGKVRQWPDRDVSGQAGMVADKGIAKGATLKSTDVRFAWPSVGISAEHFRLVESRTVQRDVEEGAPITWEDMGLGSGNEGAGE